MKVILANNNLMKYLKVKDKAHLIYGMPYPSLDYTIQI